MRSLMNERARFYEEMALRNEAAALKAVTPLQYLRYSRMQKRYEILMCREMLRLANKRGPRFRRLVMQLQARYCMGYKRYDRLYTEAIASRQVSHGLQ